MRTLLSLLLILLLCTACAQTPAIPEESSRTPEAGTAEEAEAVSEAEDHVLLTLEAPLAGGQTLTLEAVGRVLDEYSCGVREVRVYDSDALLQTVSVREVIEEVWSFGDGVLAEDFYDYTECWTVEKTMEALDLNFDGNTDFGLFGWPANNTIPYYYWTWDADAEQYRYAFTLQGVEVRPESQEISSEYKDGVDGIYYRRDYYRPDETGALCLVRQEREVTGIPNLDYDRGCALETWVPREGALIRPEEQDEADLVLIRREIPVYEGHDDNTASRFTEIWELTDGELQMTSREEFFYE